MLNAYFAAGAVSAIADDCHNQRIAECPCTIENARLVDDDGNIIFETCKSDFTFASNYFDGFATDQVPESFEGNIDQHNIDIGKQVSLACTGIPMTTGGYMAANCTTENWVALIGWYMVP